MGIEVYYFVKDIIIIVGMPCLGGAGVHLKAIGSTPKYHIKVKESKPINMLRRALNLQLWFCDAYLWNYLDGFALIDIQEELFPLSR